MFDVLVAETDGAYDLSSYYSVTWEKKCDNFPYSGIWLYTKDSEDEYEYFIPCEDRNVANQFLKAIASGVTPCTEDYGLYGIIIKSCMDETSGEEVFDMNALEIEVASYYEAVYNQRLLNEQSLKTLDDISNNA